MQRFKLRTTKNRAHGVAVYCNESGRRVTDRRKLELECDDEFEIVIEDDKVNGIQSWVIETPDSYCKGVETWPRGRGCSVKQFPRPMRGAREICFTIVGWDPKTRTKYIEDPVVIVRPKRRRR